MLFNHNRLLLFLFASLFFTFSSFAQKSDSSQEAKNSLYLDIMGTGGWYSLNYERIVYSKDKLGLGISSGASVTHLRDFDRRFNPDFSIPVSLNAFYGKNHHLEAGIGTTFASVVRADEDYSAQRYLNVNLTMTLGYRYQKPEGGFLFRAAYTPIIPVYRQITENGEFKNWFSLSFGYSF